MANIQISEPVNLNYDELNDRKYIYNTKDIDVELVYDGKLVKKGNTKLVFEHLSDSKCKFYSIYENIDNSDSLNEESSYPKGKKIGKTNDSFTFYISESKNGNPIEAAGYFSGSKECEESTKKEDKNKKKSSSGGSGGKTDINLPPLLNPYFLGNIPARIAFGGIQTLKDLVLKRAAEDFQPHIVEKLDTIIQPWYLGTDEFVEPNGYKKKTIVFNHREGIYTGSEWFFQTMDELWNERQDFEVWTSLKDMKKLAI